MPVIALQISVAAFGEILISRPAHFTILSGSVTLAEYPQNGIANAPRFGKVAAAQLKSLLSSGKDISGFKYCIEFLGEALEQL
jgi:hypothetical protein